MSGPPEFPDFDDWIPDYDAWTKQGADDLAVVRRCNEALKVLEPEVSAIQATRRAALARIGGSSRDVAALTGVSHTTVVDARGRDERQ